MLGQAVDLRGGVEDLAVQLSERVPAGETLTVAVADFPDLRGNISDLGRFVAERLTTELSLGADRFQVIERRRLVNVIEELKINMSELVDPEQVRQIGQMVGAEALVTGTISDLGNVVDVDARLVMIETNEVLPGARIGISRDQVVSTLIEQGVTGPSAGDAPASAPGDRRADPVEPVTRFTHRRIEIEAISAEWQDGEVAFHFFFQNRDEARLRVTLNVGPNQSYAVDDAGLRHVVSEPQYRQTVDFGPQIRERVHVRFGEFRERPTSITVFLQFFLGEHVDVVLRDIPVTE